MLESLLQKLILTSLKTENTDFVLNSTVIMKLTFLTRRLTVARDSYFRYLKGNVQREKLGSCILLLFACVFIICTEGLDGF